VARQKLLDVCPLGQPNVAEYGDEVHEPGGGEVDGGAAEEAPDAVPLAVEA